MHKRHASSADLLSSSSSLSIIYAKKFEAVLIADITFNRAGGGASQLWALCIANQVTDSRTISLPISGCLRPLMAIYALSRKSWKSFGCRYISINQTHNGEGAGSNGAVKYSSQITSMQIYYYLGLRSKGLLPSLCAQ